MNNDLISRQAALNALHLLAIEALRKQRYDYNALITICSNKLKDLPAVQPEQRTDKWIKCSDRMPEDNVAVNIIWANRAPVGYYANIKDKPFVDTAVYYKGIWYWWSVVVQDILGEYGKAEGWEIDSNIDVIAWMPLPEPPKVK